MFGNLPLVLIEHGTGALPTHKWGWAGRIPVALCDKLPATLADVMGQRAFRGEDGKLYRWKPRAYPTKDDALADALAHGINLDKSASSALRS